jgi:sugar-specific transcriptional regulator TrmB
MDILECLMKTGFTRHEAMLYITLGKEGALTGYEASKLSGIPRSNAYLALAGLVDKGGALRIDGDTSKYAAVPAAELIFNLRRRQEEAFDFIEKNAPAREEAAEPYYTVSGRENIINKMSYIIANAKERIYISTSPAELAYVAAELSRACAKGLKVVIITSEGFDMDGAVIYRNEKQPGQIRMIADTAHVLTGELRASGYPTALYSKNRNLVDVIRDSLKNEITLIGLKHSI